MPDQSKPLNISEKVLNEQVIIDVIAVGTAVEVRVPGCPCGIVQKITLENEAQWTFTSLGTAPGEIAGKSFVAASQYVHPLGAAEKHDD